MRMTGMQPNENFSLRDTGCSSSQNSITLPRHRWYLIKEAFSPDIVKAAIKESESVSTDIIIDPFCGSGTVPLTTSLDGYTSVGIEVNPFLAFVARAKLLWIKPNTIEKLSKIVLAKAEIGKLSNMEGYSTFSEKPDTEKWLFNTEVLRSFEGGWAATSGLYSPARDLIRLALIGAAMDCCNAVRDGKCLRYRKDWQEKKFNRWNFITALTDHINDMKEDLEISRSQITNTYIYNGDSRDLLLPTILPNFNLCITSPPYLNSFDYSDIYRPELFLGKFVKNNKDLMVVRLQTIRSHVQASWKGPKNKEYGFSYKEAMKELAKHEDDLWDIRIPLMIQAYFEDMDLILRRLRAIAQSNATVWIIVSTSAYCGVEIPVDLIIADIGIKAGWYLREVGVLRYLRTSGQNWNRWSQEERGKPRLRESVVVFEASAKKRS